MRRIKRSRRDVGVYLRISLGDYHPNSKGTSEIRGNNGKGMKTHGIGKKKSRSE